MTRVLVPKVSVILPVFNGHQHLRLAINSVLAQTFTDFELLAIDDGSTDGSFSVLREAADKDKRVYFRTRQNRGLVATLNELITWSRGDYLARMDADDVCRPLRFQKQSDYLDEHPECVAVGSGVLFIDPRGMPISEISNKLTHEELDSGYMSGVATMRICHPSVMMRKNAVVKVGGYRQEFALAEDLDLFLRLAELGRLANLPDVLFEYRQHLNSISYSQNKNSLEAAGRAVQEAWRRRGLIPDLNTFSSNSRPETKADIHRKWAWWALLAGNVATARKHAVIALARMPFSIENWRALVCAIRGH